ncbi:hypothetical protein [Vibrio splendidus]|uniref:hypothetical protein n=1 Tax=Vibrio splendidus TaxID=29497 RepID=UPI001E31D80D|nr:hypothetical protein [Vibrio splendidus]MCC4860981.1 hypothetical protein [Vibrio splendidus]
MDLGLKQKGILLFLLLAGSVQARECDNSPTPKENHIVDKGTFMVTLVDGHAPVSSYLPSGAVVKLLGKQTIYYKKRQGRPPIPQCYYQVKTNLGKSGYVLQDTLDSESMYQGEYVFPRTEIEIYKRASLEQVTDYRSQGKTSRSAVFMSSTNPKVNEKLKVIGMDPNQDFYIVTAKFLGENVKGFVFADDIDRGMAAVVDPRKVDFVDRQIKQVSSDLKQIFKTLLSDKVYDEMSGYLEGFGQGATLEMCKIPLSVTPSAELKANAWWINGSIKVEGKMMIKPENRSFSHESYTIARGNEHYDIEFMKSLSCDTESMLYPVILKIKQGSLELRRENFSNLGPIYRTKQDPAGEKQYETMLTIKSYGDWYSVYSHLDDNLSDWKAEFGDSYDVLLDILIDSISYFPPSEKRTASKTS